MGWKGRNIGVCGRLFMNNAGYKAMRRPAHPRTASPDAQSSGGEVIEPPCRLVRCFPSAVCACGTPALAYSQRHERANLAKKTGPAAESAPDRRAEVNHLGHNRSVLDIVRAAIQEIATPDVVTPAM